MSNFQSTNIPGPGYERAYPPTAQDTIPPSAIIMTNSHPVSQILNSNPSQHYVSGYVATSSGLSNQYHLLSPAARGPPKKIPPGNARFYVYLSSILVVLTFILLFVIVYLQVLAGYYGR